MKARHFALLAVIATLGAVQHANAADGSLGQFAGSFTGSGKIIMQNGSAERIRCRSNNTSNGAALGLSMRCASDSYKFELTSDLANDGGNISGSWNETTRGVVGSVSGRISGGNIQATASAIGVTASLSIRAAGNTLNVSMKSPGSEVSEVTVTMARGGKPAAAAH